MINDFLTSKEFNSIISKKFDINLIEQNYSQIDFLNAIKYNCEMQNSILIIVENTLVDTIFTITQRGKAKVCIINSGCGLASFSEKGYWDLRDINKANSFGLEVFETSYSSQLLELLGSWENSCYIRTNKHVIPKEELPKFQQKSDFLIFDDSGNDYTIVSFGALLLDALYAKKHLESSGKTSDLFISNKIFFTISKELSQSLEKTKKLYVIIDQHRDPLYNSWIYSSIYNSNLKNIKIEIIYPYYNEVSSIAEEYIYEQAKIDGFSISKRIDK